MLCVNTCAFCERRFRIIGRMRATKKFCSDACRYAAAKKRAPWLMRHVGKTAAQSPHWKGGRVSDGRGYVLLRVGRTYVLEHRHVMARHLGRPLLRTEIVHHVNHVKDDNRIENLELVSTVSAHRGMHRPAHGRWTAKYAACRGCGTTSSRHSGRGYCGTCYRKYVRSP